MAFKRYHKGKTKSRSGYEERIKKDLDARGITYGYESIKMQYTKVCCKHCGGAAVTSTYTPDFVFDATLPNVVESKGFFNSSDRTKMLAVKRDNPKACIRIIFQRNDRLKAGVEKRYGDWADQHGFEWASGESIPDRWITCHIPVVPLIVKVRKKAQKTKVENEA